MPALKDRAVVEAQLAVGEGVGASDSGSATRALRISIGKFRRRPKRIPIFSSLNLCLERER